MAASGDGALLPPPTVPASVWARLAAFAVDAAVLVVILGGAWLTGVAVTWALVATTFICYHGVLTWLTERTPGKALFGLRLRRVSGRPYRLRPAWLPWTVGRAGLGYLLFDGFFVVGLACAIRHPQHRPTHDFVFNSHVVVVPADLMVSEPTRWGKRHRARLERLAADTEASTERLQPRNPIVRFFVWLVGRVAALSVVLWWLRRAWRWIRGQLIHRAGSPPTVPKPTTIPTRVGIAAGTAAVSGLVWTTVVPPAETTVDERPILIGVRDFGESELLGEIYEQALDANGHNAETVPLASLGREPYDATDRYDAMTARQVDLMIGYVVTERSVLGGLEPVFPLQPTGHLDQMYRQVRLQLEQRDLVAFEPSPAIDTVAYVMTRDRAADLGIATLSDLFYRAGDLTFGDSGCSEGVDCPPGLAPNPVVGANATPLDASEVATALEAGTIDVGVTFSTDGVLADDDLIVLPDDGSPGPLCCWANNVVPIATLELATSGAAELRDVINAVSAELTTEQLIELNRRHDIEHEAPELLAQQWLSDHHITGE